ncbi:TolC family protein [Desulfobacterales bacterium HSG16]|nr:TolC family protein [Desulfobacterales bacterium HSG16]
MSFRIFRFILILILIPGVGEGSARASSMSDIEAIESRISGNVVLSDLLEYAFLKNPSIQAAKHKWKAVVETYRTSASYPDPMIMATYFPQPIETRLGPQDWNMTISQVIPFPGKLSKKREQVETRAMIARSILDKTVRNVLVSVQESFYEISYIRKARQIAEKNMALLDLLRKTGETAYADDRAALIDVIKAQSQTAQLRYDLLLLEELEATENAKINSLLNRDPDAVIGKIESVMPSPLAYSLKELYSVAAENREEIKIARLRSEEKKIGVELAGYNNLPNFKVGMFYASIGEPEADMQPDDAGQDAIGIQFSMNLPLWFSKNKSRVKKAGAELEMAESVTLSKVNETMSGIRNLYFRYQNAQRLQALYEDELLPQAIRSTELAETWFREGEGSFSDFIESRALLYNFELSAARARSDLGKYLVRLERLAGHNLTIRDISEDPDKSNVEKFKSDNPEKESK